MNPDQRHDLAEYYDTTDLAENIEQAAWEEPEPVAEPMVTYALRLPSRSSTSFATLLRYAGSG
ncbi:MAG TPA: hypothetical protein VFQ77_08285 [Pseudonocardiaceae bacterium]|jgi:hypothetical protein|nr:hypothetical protein [Pseudonocardiaceae bacterium]